MQFCQEELFVKLLWTAAFENYAHLDSIEQQLTQSVGIISISFVTLFSSENNHIENDNFIKMQLHPGISSLDIMNYL